MEQPPTGRQLVGEGRPITLADGTEVHIKMDNRAMVKIEELFGSYNDCREQMRSGVKGNVFTAINKAVFCGLQHDEQWRKEWAKVLDLLDQNRVVDEYYEAILEAFTDAFPPVAQEEVTEQPSAAVTDESPGPTSPIKPADTSELASTSSST